MFSIVWPLVFCSTLFYFAMVSTITAYYYVSEGSLELPTLSPLLFECWDHSMQQVVTGD